MRQIKGHQPTEHRGGRKHCPDWGCEKISALLLRGPALPASPQAVARVLHEAGYELEESPTPSHSDKIRHFERARPNQRWQIGPFWFLLKRQNCRVYLVAFMARLVTDAKSYRVLAAYQNCSAAEVV